MRRDPDLGSALMCSICGAIGGFIIGILVFGYYRQDDIPRYKSEARAAGYKQGQIDALQGKIKVRQVVRLEWEEIAK